MRLHHSVPIALLALLASGCAAFSDDAADDGEIDVAAAFYPLAYTAERVTADTPTEVATLTRPGGEAHDLELGVGETAMVADADLVVYQEGFQPAVDDAVEQNAGGATLDAAEVVDLVPLTETAEEHAEHDHGHDGDDGHDHDHGDVDPHFWQDPLRVADLGDAVAERLAEIDPDHAEVYEQNAADLRADLEQLDASYETGLLDCDRDTIVVSHAAFGYLEKYGLRLASIVGLSPDAEPTGAAIGELQELIRTEGVTTVFSEPLEPALGESLAADLDLTNAVLDPVEGLADDATGDDYLSLMEGNLEAIREANGCR